MKSPIKQKPLRNPGESLQQQIDDIFYEDILLYVMLSTFVMIMAGLEWWRWYAHMPPNPVLWSVFMIIVLGVTAWKIKTIWKKVKNIKLGLEGERAEYAPT